MSAFVFWEILDGGNQASDALADCWLQTADWNRL